MNKHLLTVVAVVMALISFGAGSMPAGALFMGLAVWLELYAAYQLSKKYKSKKQDSQG